MGQMGDVRPKVSLLRCTRGTRRDDKTNGCLAIGCLAESLGWKLTPSDEPAMN
jgi:hypothetical protein